MPETETVPAIAGDKKRRPKSRRVRRIVTGVILLLLALGLGYFYFFLARPVGSGPAGPTVDAKAFGRPWTSQKVVILGLGDSVTRGFGASEGRSYFDRLVTNPKDEFDDMKGKCLKTVLPNIVQVQNLSVSGSTSIFHLQRIRSLPRHPPDEMGIVLITTGGNDIIHNYGRTPPREGAMYGASLQQAHPWIDAFENRLDQMVLTLQERFPGGCHIFLANIYDPTDGTGDATGAPPLFSEMVLPPFPDALKIHQAYNAIIERCAEKYPFVHLVNIHDPFLGHGTQCTKFWKSTYRSDDPHFWYHFILEDPNDRGYDALRRLFLLEMIRAFNAPPGSTTAPAGAAIR